MMNENNQRSLMNAIQRDVMTYVRELEQRIYQLEQTAKRARDNYSMMVSPSLEDARKQLKEIAEIADFWQSGTLEQECSTLESQISNFISTQLPSSVEPYSSQITEWKNKFNRQMSSVGRDYRKLNESLIINIDELESAASVFYAQKKQVSYISKEISDMANEFDNIVQDTSKNLSTNTNDLEISLSGLYQQVQIDLLRAKSTTNSTISNSLASCRNTSLSETFDSLQTEINQQCSQMESSLADVHNSIEKSEKQWKEDLEQVKSEIKLEIESTRRNSGSCFNLSKKLLEAQRKADEIQELMKSIE